MIADTFRSLFAWCVQTEGSSRSSALIRIFLVLIIWTRWGSELLLYRSLDTPAYLILSLSYFASTTLMLLGLFSRASTLWAGLTTLSMYYYFGVELGIANECGGRAPLYDVIDVTFSALALGDVTGVGDGVDADDNPDHSNTGFPFLASP